jgi:hypothetical protein
MRTHAGGLNRCRANISRTTTLHPTTSTTATSALRCRIPGLRRGNGPGGVTKGKDRLLRSEYGGDWAPISRAEGRGSPGPTFAIICGSFMRFLLGVSADERSNSPRRVGSYFD